MLTEDQRRERREQSAADLAEKRELELARLLAYNRDNQVRANRLAVEPPFWGERYAVDRVERTRGAGVQWDIVDTHHPRRAMVERTGTKASGLEQTRRLNGDPTANYNGMQFPKVHSAGNVWYPMDLCDCQDAPAPYPTPEGWQAPNTCGGLIGTYCVTHGTHDACPREVRGIALASDPERIAVQRHELVIRQHELDNSQEWINSEWERLDALERVALRQLAATR